LRKIVIFLVVLLTLTGLLVRFEAALSLAPAVTRPLALVHYWGGLLFLVMFPLYAWDHIRHNRRWLTRARGVTVSGVVQTVSAVLLMLSGLVIIAYGVQAWQLARDLHHWLTYPLAASVALHFLVRKDWRG
jgi:hypothetical protein